MIVAPWRARRRAQSALAKEAPAAGTPYWEACLRVCCRQEISARWLALQFGRAGLTEHQRRLLGGEEMRRRAYAALERHREGRPGDGRWATE